MWLKRDIIIKSYSFYQLEMVFANKTLVTRLITSSSVISTGFTSISVNVCIHGEVICL